MSCHLVALVSSNDAKLKNYCSHAHGLLIILAMLQATLVVGSLHENPYLLFILIKLGEMKYLL